MHRHLVGLFIPPQPGFFHPSNTFATYLHTLHKPWDRFVRLLQTVSILWPSSLYLYLLRCSATLEGHIRIAALEREFLLSSTHRSPSCKVEPGEPTTQTEAHTKPEKHLKPPGPQFLPIAATAGVYPALPVPPPPARGFQHPI